MPPRLQCLNAIKHVSNQTLSFKVAFSTTARSLAERSSSAASLLSVDNEPSQSSPTISRPSFAPSNSISRPPQRYARERNVPMPGNQDSNTRLLSLIGNRRSPYLNRQSAQDPTTTAEDLARDQKSKSLNRMIMRRWKAGDTYAPHDLSPQEMKKWSVRQNPDRDVFDALDMNPKDEYRNFAIMSEYMTPMGRIKHSMETGLRKRNQRRIAKAIRRSIGLGLMPSVHRHPELLYQLQKKRDSFIAKSSVGPVGGFMK